MACTLTLFANTVKPLAPRTPPCHRSPMSHLRRHLKAEAATLLADLREAILFGTHDDATAIAHQLAYVDHLLTLDRTPDPRPHGYLSLWRQRKDWKTMDALHDAAGWEQAGLDTDDLWHRQECFQRAKQAMAETRPNR